MRFINKKYLYWLVLLFVGASLTELSQNNSGKFVQNYRIISPQIPSKLYFCKERVPLESWDVKERFDRELIVNTYYHSSTLLYLKRANRWFPVIERILRRYGVPQDFKYMAVAESGLDNVTSPKGAVGFWQLLKSTAVKYGLEVNKEIDERYDVVKSTIAACKFLKQAKARYGSWTMAAAAYNMGTNGIDEQIKRQKSHYYYNLLLNEETSRFVFRILAIKTVMQHPQKYGFDLKKKDLYKPLRYFAVKIKRPVKQWADFASKFGINYKILKLYNPWLRQSYLRNRRRRTYFIKIPVKGSIEIPESKK